MNILKKYLSATPEVKEEFNNVALKTIKGQIPSGLNGYLFHNGNGNHQHLGVRYQHVFDGDGMINKFHFQKNKKLKKKNEITTSILPLHLVHCVCNDRYRRT